MLRLYVRLAPCSLHSGDGGRQEEGSASLTAPQLYREFTDETFTVMKSREPEWEHLGLLGPTLHAEVCAERVCALRAHVYLV